MRSVWVSRADTISPAAGGKEITCDHSERTRCVHSLVEPSCTHHEGLQAVGGHSRAEAPVGTSLPNHVSKLFRRLQVAVPWSR